MLASECQSISSSRFCEKSDDVISRREFQGFQEYSNMACGKRSRQCDAREKKALHYDKESRKKTSVLTASVWMGCTAKSIAATKLPSSGRNIAHTLQQENTEYIKARQQVQPGWLSMNDGKCQRKSTRRAGGMLTSSFLVLLLFFSFHCIYFLIL